MCVYCKAASAVLDTLWVDAGFRDYFRHQGTDLRQLGVIMHSVFVPAYLDVRQGLAGGPLELLEAQVTEDLLGPFYDRPGFRELWDAWDQSTRDAFLREQSEMGLGRLLVAGYASALADAYCRAFEVHVHRDE